MIHNHKKLTDAFASLQDTYKNTCDVLKQKCEKMGTRVLVLEDSPTDKNLMKHILLDEGYEVTTASNGVEGMQRIIENNIGLVLTDVVMPRMDGMGVIRALKDHPYISVIVTTALSPDNQIVQKIQSLGVPLLFKPIVRERLLKLVDTYFGPPVKVKKASERSH